MKITRHQFLTCSVGTHYKDSRISRSYLFNHFLYLLDGRRLTYHLLAIDLLLEGLGFLDKMHLILRILYGDQDPVKVQRLFDEVERSLLDAVYGSRHISMAGNHHDSRIYTHGSEFREGLHSVHNGHLDVTEDDIIFFLFHHLDTLLAVFGHIHIISFVFKNFLEGVSDRTLIINNQDLHIF